MEVGNDFTPEYGTSSQKVAGSGFEAPLVFATLRTHSTAAALLLYHALSAVHGRFGTHLWNC